MSMKAEFATQSKHGSRYVDVSPPLSISRELDDVSFMTAMLLSTMGNYASTGHFGGPLSYVPAAVAFHLAGGPAGGLRYDIRSPKLPFTDKYMMAAGHCAPTNYALWIILYEAMLREYKATGDKKYYCDPHVAMLAIDVLGFRRSPGACKELLQENGLQNDPLFDQAKLENRGIRALMGHTESTDVTGDVNGGPSGVGVATMAGKCVFWDAVGAPLSTPKVIGFEGEFAFTEGHAQELKTIALSQRCGKRLRLYFSWNNAGIDDELVGPKGVIKSDYASDYDMVGQFLSYGWNVIICRDGGSISAVLAAMQAMEDSPESDRRPMVCVSHTVKGWWPSAAEGKIGAEKQIIGPASHPYGFAPNAAYYVRLAESFESRFNVKFVGIRDGPPANERARLQQFLTNTHVILSVLDQNSRALSTFLSSQLLSIAQDLPLSLPTLHYPTNINPFASPRLHVDALPLEPISGISLFSSPNAKKGARRALGEVLRFFNLVSENRLMTIAADLSSSIGVESAHFSGHYDPVLNVRGTRLKGAIQEAGNAATMCGLVSQSISQNPEEHVGLWGVVGTYGAFTPLMYLPVRIFSQQSQESPFRLGCLTVITGHSGVLTGPDARSHYGVYSPTIWYTGFPSNHVTNLYCADYNDVAPAYAAATQRYLRNRLASVIVVHVARPDSAVFDRNEFYDKDIKAASKGAYILVEANRGENNGTVLVQGTAATVGVVKILKELKELNVRVVAVVSPELFMDQSSEYKENVLSRKDRADCTFVTDGTKKVHPLPGLGIDAEEYAVSPDWDERWRTGGMEQDMVLEAKLDPQSILAGIKRFVERKK